MSRTDLPAPEVVATTVANIVRRGCRPQHVVVGLPWMEDTQLAESKALAFLQAVANAGSVNRVCVNECTPLTPTIATAIAGISHKLTYLAIAHNQYADSRVVPAPIPEEAETAAAGGELLLRLVGAGLEELHIYPDVKGRFFPPPALSALSHCTGLQKLTLQLPNWVDSDMAGGIAAELRVYEHLSAMTALRRLDLEGGANWLPPLEQRSAMACALEACLSRLTGLHGLRIGLRRLRHFANKQEQEFDSEEPGPSLPEQMAAAEADVGLAHASQLRAVAAAEWRAVASPARNMPKLVDLRVPLQANLADLRHLTALTSLRVGALALPAQPSEPTFALPPSLCRLETHAPMSVHVAAALQPPPAPEPEERCTLIAGGRLWSMPATPWVLELDEADVDAVGRLREEAAAAMRKAAGVLSSFDFRLPDEIKDDMAPGLCVWVHTTEDTAVRPPAPAGEGADGTDSHVASWMGALSALKLQHLALVNIALPPPDMLGLARCMPDLEELDLHGCSYAVFALPLLAGMQRLEELYLHSRGWGWPAHLPEAMECAFLALLAADRRAEQPPLRQQQQQQQQGHAQEQQLQGQQLQQEQEPREDGDTDDEGAGGDGRVALAGSLPRLRYLQITCPEAEVEALERALAPARRELERRGRGTVIVLPDE